jgi:glycosyltransferase involved in cell wall biosynthesis
MKRKKIKYIAMYTSKDLEKESRRGFLPAINKIDYICSSLVNSGYEVEIISPSWTEAKKGCYSGHKIWIANQVKLITFSTFGTKTRIENALKYFWSLLQAFLFLAFNTKKGESVLVYHSYFLIHLISALQKVRKINLILEVEEIYSIVQPSKYWDEREIKYINKANKYIFSTELLNKKINILNKPYAIIYGTYQVEEDRGVKFDDDKIHVVYAGIFDPRKGGALAAAAAAEFLPKNYHVHIIGFGSNDDKSMLLKKIDEISKITKATVTYDGLLRDEEYIQFLQKCHIGLSTQNPDAEYNDTSFPSKILSYMANGLRVVTIRIKAIETSAIGDKVFYYDQQNPKDIAGAIMSIDFNEPYDSRNIIKKLDAKFLNEIKSLLKD